MNTVESIMRLAHHYRNASEPKVVYSTLLAALQEFAAEKGEPVAYEFRMRAEWVADWGLWSPCNKEQHELYIRVPKLHDWIYETRALYAAPQPAQPVSQPLTVQEVEQILHQHDYELHGDRVRYIVRMTEQAHGIGAIGINGLMDAKFPQYTSEASR